MKHPIDRREFLKLAGLGGVVFASSLGVARAAGTMAAAKGGTYDEFYFVQLSDTHWGFEGQPNPDAKGTLKKAVAAVNSLSAQPDFASGDHDFRAVIGKRELWTRELGHVETIAPRPRHVDSVRRDHPRPRFLRRIVADEEDAQQVISEHVNPALPAGLEIVTNPVVIPATECGVDQGPHALFLP